MKEFVKVTIKEPTIKRRNSLTSFMEMLPLEEQKIDIQEMSLYGDDVSFKEKTAERENVR